MVEELVLILNLIEFDSIYVFVSLEVADIDTFGEQCQSGLLMLSSL
jgi:hypothetical protein